MAQQFGDGHLLHGVVFDHQQSLAPRSRIIPDLRYGLLDAFCRRRLGHEGEGAAREAMLPVFVQGHDLNGDVADEGVVLQLAEHVPAQHIGQENIERDGSRPIFERELQSIDAARGDKNLEARIMRKVDQHARIVGIVFNDQENRVPGNDVDTIVRHRIGWPFGSSHRETDRRRLRRLRVCYAARSSARHIAKANRA